MNNPLAQKYNYYLNESHRLSEELQNETEYSELLENILVELIGEEAFYGLFEDIQTPARVKQVSDKKSDLNVKKLYRKTAANAENAYGRLLSKDAKEQEDTKNVYGKGGKKIGKVKYYRGE
jgi:hypothetical protein